MIFLKDLHHVCKVQNRTGRKPDRKLGNGSIRFSKNMRKSLAKQSLYMIFLKDLHHVCKVQNRTADTVKFVDNDTLYFAYATFWEVDTKCTTHYMTHCMRDSQSKKRLSVIERLSIRIWVSGVGELFVFGINFLL